MPAPENDEFVLDLLARRQLWTVYCSERRDGEDSGAPGKGLRRRGDSGVRNVDFGALQLDLLPENLRMNASKSRTGLGDVPRKSRERKGPIESRAPQRPWSSREDLWWRVVTNQGPGSRRVRLQPEKALGLGQEQAIQWRARAGSPPLMCTSLLTSLPRWGLDIG